jgi:hypothetical protein
VRDPRIFASTEKALGGLIVQAHIRFFCFCLEFYDYTFDDHFQGEPVPVYLPRRDINEYLMQRVTRNAPTFFEDYFEFDTEVVKVSEVTDGGDAKGQFSVTVRKVQTGETSTRLFDLRA